MTRKPDLKGIVCAAVTPMRDGQPDLENLQLHVRTLADEGCDGILLLGTTGEGPSLSLSERESVIEATLSVSGQMKVMVGTGFSALSDTIKATRKAFEMGVDTVVIVPPFYYKAVSDQGLLEFYRRVLEEAVPDDGLMMVYHIPQVTGVPISIELLEGLIAIGGERMAGIKDSSGDLEHGRSLIERFPQLNIFVGHDKVLLGGLQSGAVGCITAGANVLAPLAVQVYRAFSAGQDAEHAQEQLSRARAILDRYRPSPGTLKSLLELRYRPPVSE